MELGLKGMKIIWARYCYNLFDLFLFNQIIFIYSDSDMRSDSKLNGYRPVYNRNFDYQNSYISNRSGISAVNSEHLKKMVQEV